MTKWKNGTLIDKTMYSLNGLRSAFLTENAVRRESGALAALVLLAIIHGSPVLKVLCVFLICLFPIIVELINTASETIIDLVLGAAYREDVRMAKDMLSAAVMLSLIISYGSSLLLIFF
jgi:diacylglycerol kinase (ATP)